MSSIRFDEDIWLLQRVSLGANFELFLAFWPEENDKVLIKKIRDDIDPSRKAEAEERLLKEAATLEEFWSPYFPKVYDIRRQGDQENNNGESGCLYLIVQYFAGVSLREYLNLHMEKKTVSFYFIQNFVHEMDHALSYLHDKKGIVHLDISPDNIIVTSDNKIKIIDFEDSRKAGSELDASKLRGKEKYLSPQLLELIQEQRPGTFAPKWDRYAYGKTLQELCAQTHGVDRLKTYSLKKKIRSLKSKRDQGLIIPSFKLPAVNMKYVMVATTSFIILALTVLGLEILGRSQAKRVVKASNIVLRHNSDRDRVLKTQSSTKKVVHVKKTRKRKVQHKVNRRPSLPSRPKAVASTQRKRSQRINNKAIQRKARRKFREHFRKLISKKDPYLKECMSYETSGHKGNLALSFHLKSTKGRAQSITFNENDNLNNLTKSCLAALYADIVFPEHPSHEEVEIVQHFTFAKENPPEDSLIL